jgi:hypothetical protein
MSFAWVVPNFVVDVVVLFCLGGVDRHRKG